MLRKRSHKKTKELDFIFSYNSCLYRGKASKTGKIKIIFSVIPSLVGAENIGSEASPKWHFRFKIHSQIHREVELLLSPKEFSSNLTFKKSIMRKIPVIFTGNKNDFNMKEMKEMKALNCATV